MRKTQKKIDKILAKLDDIQKTDEAVSPLAEGLISIIKGVDSLTKKK